MAEKEMKYAQYEERILGLPSIALRSIIADATEAMKTKAGYYSDEIMLCRQELSRRLQSNKTNREPVYHATLTEIYVILKNAGYCSNYLLDDLRDLVNDARRPATEQDEITPPTLWAYGDVAVIKDGWDRAGTVLGVIGPAVFCEQWWVPVIDPDEEDPTWHKEAGLTNEGK